MNPDLARRALFTFCVVVAAGLGFRELTSVRQTQEAAAAVIATHRDEMHARTVAMHREGRPHAAASMSDKASVASAANVASAASAANAASTANVADAANPASTAKAANAARRPRSEPTPRARLIALRAPLSLASTNNPFAASSWLPPPPPPVAAPPAPPDPVAPPTAPPVPFTYLGELDAKTAKPQVFLSAGDRLLIVSPGDVVDGQYRVESISENDMVLTYLPLDQRQVLSTQAKENK